MTDLYLGTFLFEPFQIISKICLKKFTFNEAGTTEAT